MHRIHELVRLHREGKGAREVARLLGMSPNTERSYRNALWLAGLLEGDAAALPEGCGSPGVSSITRHAGGRL